MKSFLQYIIEDSEMKSWFGNSKVVDEQGHPLIVYHGTQDHFDVFKTPAWFTEDEGYADRFSGEWHLNGRTPNSKVIRVYLNIESPYHTNDWRDTEENAYNPEWREELIAQGYDGVRFQDGNEVEWIAFYPDQIRNIDETI